LKAEIGHIVESGGKAMAKIDFSGRVAIVTGAGGGLGRTYALELAKRGAKVVVNDFGGARDGTGGGTSMADAVVAEIKAMGGDAVGHYQDISSTEGANSLIKAGLDKWGKFDALINNAGILRDKMSFNMTDDEWDLVIKVHMRGHFMPARAAVQYFRQAAKENKLPNGGAIVNTSSTSGLLGNAGQVNYSAAKMGIVRMTYTRALEFLKYNIRINAIAPMAYTRLTEDLPMAAALKSLTPAKIAPFTIFLCSDAAAGITGQVFGVFGNIIQLYRAPRPVHYWQAKGEIWDVNDVAQLAQEIKDIAKKVNAPYMPGSPGPKFQG
jgi:NAD(P)-dependent dehydrogenase (short-subunit alcohol dehydrogenase family)